MESLVFGVLCVLCGLLAGVLGARALDFARSVLTKGTKIEKLEAALQDLHTLLDTDATELDTVTKRFEQQLAVLEKRLEFQLQRQAPRSSGVPDDLLQEIVQEVQMLGGELQALKRPQGINPSAFGSNPLAAVTDIQVAARTQNIEARGELDPERRRLRVLVDIARESCAPTACCNCKYWDQDEGQDVLKQAPVFARVAAHVTPNRMGTPVLVDAEGDALPPDQQPTPLLPAKLNKWELFGACLRKSQVLHASDTCEEFSPSDGVAA